MAKFLIRNGLNPGREFEFERVAEAMKRSDGTPENMTHCVLEAVHSFLGEAKQNDDLTLVCFGPRAS